MGTTIIGIDPGLSGAIAVVKSPIASVHDMPTLEIIAGRKRSKTTGKMVDVKRNKYNILEIKQILQQVRDMSDGSIECWLEKSQAMPDQGGVSNFNYGVGFGILQAVVMCLGIPLNLVAPVTWKNKIMAGQGKEKDAAVYRASQLFPGVTLTTPRGRLLDGRAEALLIAEYGRRFGSANNTIITDSTEEGDF